MTGTIGTLGPGARALPTLFLGFSLIQPSLHNGIMPTLVHILKVCVAQKGECGPTNHILLNHSGLFWVMLLLQPL